MGIDPAATMAYDHRDRQATVAAFSASGENARRYACAEIDDTDYTPAQKSSAGDRFGNVVRKVKRGLKIPIVDDIKL
jgi:hypothetical protein